MEILLVQVTLSNLQLLKLKSQLPNILNDPAEKKSCWDILKLKDENHGVDIVPIIEENPIHGAVLAL